MTAVAMDRPRSAPRSPTLATLAAIEAKRYARHPLFLVGLVLGIVTSAGERGPIELDYQVIPAFFIGVFGVVVAARLTGSTRVSRPVVDAAPVSQLVRTAALCWACLVPAAAGLVLVLIHRAFVLADPFAGWEYGTYSATDRLAITIVLPVIACAGGPLLGVAVGRWLRFPGAPLLAVVVLVGWVNVAAYVPEQSSIDPGTVFARGLHMLTPYTAFGSGNGDGNNPVTSVRSFTGSPLWFAVWTLALCGLAVAAALIRDLDRTGRRRVARVFVLLAGVAVAVFVLAAVNGNQRQYDTNSHHTVPHVASAPSDG
jgi:hypothetical protein